MRPSIACYPNNTGFAIWNLDNYFCVHLRSTRQWLTDKGIGSLGHFTEGHGYWHLLTGYGSLKIFTACIGESPVPWCVCLLVELCLSVKTSPGEWDYDPQDWIPIVCPTAKRGDEKSSDSSNGHAADLSNGSKSE